MRKLVSLGISCKVFREFSKDSRKKLLKELDKSIEFEYNHYKIDQSVPIFLQFNQFELEDQEDTSYVYLRKNAGNLALEINFEAKVHVNPADLEKFSEETGQKDPGKYSEFNVFLKSPANNSGFYAECCSYDQNLVIRSLCYSKDMKVFENPKNAGELYQGPAFDGEEHEYYHLFSKYLYELGVTKEVVAFVEIYSLDKNHRLYMAWLTKVRNFLL